MLMSYAPHCINHAVSETNLSVTIAVL